jgi:hypothetical protein
MSTSLRLRVGPTLVCPVLALAILVGGAGPAQAIVRDPGPQAYIAAALTSRCDNWPARTRSWSLHHCRSSDRAMPKAGTAGM